MVKSTWSRIFYFEIQQAPSELLLSSAKNLPREAELAWLAEFQNKNSGPLSPSFLSQQARKGFRTKA